MGRMEDTLNESLKNAEGNKEALEIVKKQADRYGITEIVASADAKLKALETQAETTGGSAAEVGKRTEDVDAEIAKVTTDAEKQVVELTGEKVSGEEIVSEEKEIKKDSQEKIKELEANLEEAKKFQVAHNALTKWNNLDGVLTHPESRPVTTYAQEDGDPNTLRNLSKLASQRKFEIEFKRERNLPVSNEEEQRLKEASDKVNILLEKYRTEQKNIEDNELASYKQYFQKNKEFAWRSQSVRMHLYQEFFDFLKSNGLNEKYKVYNSSISDKLFNEVQKNLEEEIATLQSK